MLGLGLLAGAVLQTPLRAQVRDTLPKKKDTTLTVTVPIGPERADSLLRDSLAKRDSIFRARIRADTIKSPLTHAPAGAELSVGRRLSWSRDSLLGTGAVTVADLVDRVEGATTTRGGWIASPAVGAYIGDAKRVRVFYDGFEMPALDPRTGNVLDLTQVSLWTAEDAVVEHAPDEVRVYLRSWRVRNTNPETRTDVFTGDQQTNLYRGFYGRRFASGAAFQFGAQQYGTTPPTLFGSASDQTSIMGRLGLARRDWSIDAYAVRVGRHRGIILGQTAFDITGDSIPQVESARTDSYVRIGFRDPDVDPLWLQLMAVGSSYKYTGVRTLIINNPRTAFDSALATTSLDSGAFRSQYIASVGSTRGPLALTASARASYSAGHSAFAPSFRAVYQSAMLSAIGFAEGKGFDSTSRAEVTVRVAPLSFVSLLGGVGRTSQNFSDHQTSSTNWLRAEGGLRIHDLWLVGGVVRRDSALVGHPRVFFDTTIAPLHDKPATGLTAAIRGRVWRFIEADVWGVRWNDTAGFYRPRYETRSELFVRTNLLNRFPTGDFGLNAGVTHEYRSGVTFPSESDATGVTRTVGYRTISTLLEIRILTATLSWQFRNVLGERYQQFPGFAMPRQTNIYGVRWFFSN
jgi:hypothetical protein